MPENRVAVQTILWREVFPGLMVLRAFRLAMQVRQMAVSALAVLLTLAGWWLLGYAFSGSENDPVLEQSIESYRAHPWPSAPVEPQTAASFDGDLPKMASLPTAPADVKPWSRDANFTAPPHMGVVPANALLGPWLELSGPFRQIFSPNLTIVGLAFVLLAALWANGVWALAGGVITRLAAVELAREERLGLRQAFRFTIARLGAYFAAPLFPLVGVLIFLVPMALVGLLLRGGAVGIGLAGILWPFYLLAAVVMAILLVGLLFGWPLMWPTISAEGGDSFSAMSHSYSYVYQRPLYGLLLVILASVIGILASFAANGFAELVIYLARWGASWGGGEGVIANDATFHEAGWFGARLIDFWSGCVRLVAIGFTFAYFWCASTAIYFQLRHSVDGAETDEVFLEPQDERFGMPSLGENGNGGESTPNEDEPS